MNHEDFALDLFQKEKLGLEQLGEYNSLSVPRVYQIGQFEESAFLLMEFIETDATKKINTTQFGIQLAELHLQFENSFGWEHDNYIGSLHQNNSKFSDWSEFYIHNRLAPQIRLAVDQNLLDQTKIPSLSHLLTVCNRLFKNVRPSPIHGDLWSGNYLIDTTGKTYVIDPAFYYGYHEVDIAMSQLFGGFPREFFDGYYSIFPKKKEHSERINVLQLYYLLVHLNLFGKSYLRQVMSIFSNL